MDIVRRGILPLRFVLVLTFGMLVMLQLFSFPGMFAHMAQEDPDVASLRWPLTALVAAVLLCGEVVVVCTWRLLTLVRRDRIFTAAAHPWVDALVGAVATAWCLLAASFAVAGATADDPGGPVLMLFVLLVTSAAALLLPVMRSLLRQATVMRARLDVRS